MNEIIKMTLLGDIVVPQEFVTIDCNFSGKTIANLEAPVCREKQFRRPKAGPYLASFAIPSILQGAVFSLANNHIMDYGEKGLQDTISACQALDIATVGAGKTLEVAQKPLIFKINNLRIGVLARCETQFGTATLRRSGVAALDATIYEAIRQLKQEVDIVIVSIHGSVEMSPWPSPQRQDLLRSFIDAGATVVHGHHAHVPQGYEEYNNGLIFYGLGNFCVDPEKWRDFPNTLWSIIGEVIVSQKGIEDWTIKTAVIRQEERVKVQESNNSEFALHQKYLAGINYPLSDRKLLTGLWQELSVRMYYLFNAKWLGFELAVNGKDRISSFIRDVRKNLLSVYRRQGVSASQSDLFLWYHLFACDSHRDAIATALGVLSCELDDLRIEQTKALVNEMLPWLESLKSRDKV